MNLTQDSPAAKVECNACPVLCQITEGRAGACDRYANQNGVLVRVDPVVLFRRDSYPASLEASPLQPRTALTPLQASAQASEQASAPSSASSSASSFTSAERGVFVTGVG